ncbi:MAG: TonB-dependent receptor [Xanthomonadales bacterium]|jgi:iron complex outermembrane receptor protein|nr:TonB-dependent receptor [Xanthomonadales bacterium]
MNSWGNSSNKSFLRRLLLALMLCFTAGATWAQDTTEEQEEETGNVIESEDAADLDRVVVTGSRLQRETYTSIAPLQIITAEGSREAGLVDAAEILQNSTAAGGLQIDLTFSGFVLDNGPGASTIDLRGMGAARTLVLLNGRRLAPSGVEGAPSAPDLNMVPSLMVRQYDVLLDGASSVYGSDAVAGVTNILMRQDFDGFEFNAFYNKPEQTGGESYTVAALYGKNYDRGFFGIGIEYQDNTEVTWGDRDWTGGCDQHHEITTNGEFRSQDLYYSELYDMRWDECRLGTTAGRISVPFAGSIYNTPGYTNGGWPNFSESNYSDWFGIDGNGDGETDVSFRDYDFNGNPVWQDTHLFPKTDRLSIMGYGEYTFEGEMNNTIFAEFNYNERDYYQKSGQYQFWPYVAPNNPYNLCNPNAEGGVDCGLANDAMWQNPNVIGQFQELWGGYCNSIGVPLEGCTPEAFGFLSGPIGPAQTIAITSVYDDRNKQYTSMEQIRGVIGMKGDLPFVDWGSMNSWVYDAAFTYTKSSGESWYQGIRADRYDYAAGWYSSTNTPCENDIGYSLNPYNPGQGTFTGTEAGCVPVNMLAPSLYTTGADAPGDFGTQAERDYLFDSREFDTDYTQMLFSAYANGFLFELPGGTAMGGIGLEWRSDEIESIPNEVAREGLFFGWFADGGATGKKWTREVFGEIKLPLLAGVPGAQELRVNLSGRWTEDEYYGSDFTYSGKLGWRPINSLLLRGTIGTSFRAPNVREVFLLSQTGFNGITDPCVLPEGAYDPFTGEYVPELDQRAPEVKENCRLNGVTPPGIDNNGFANYSVEIGRGGTPNLEAETSKSWTGGFSWEEPWAEAFDIVLGWTYYETEINDTIVEPSGQYIVNQCYTDPEYDSSFCQYIERDAEMFLDFLDGRFINRDNETYRGMDFNANYDQHFSVGTRAVSIGIDLVAHKQIEASENYIDDNGNENFFDSFGDRFYPKWKGQVGLRFDVDDFRFTWVTNYRGKTEQPDVYRDDFDDIFGSAGSGFFCDTCLGPPDDVYCRDYADIDEYWLHSASFYWYGDTFTIGAGIRNVFDEEPPKVDGNEVWNSINNRPIGIGYNLMGRSYFVNFVWKI